MDRILVVDDDPVIVKLYQIILKKEGFVTDVATCGADALASIAGQKPAIILLDVVLPDYSGLDVCRIIKDRPEYVGVKIILVSGMDISPTHVAEGIELGADDYLVKPFDPKELMARIKNCLKLQKVEAELRDKNLELKNLSMHLQSVREEERKFFAREVQEELGQLTAVLKMDVDWLAINAKGASNEQLERIEHASTTANLIINTIRRIATSLRPSMIDELGLHESIEWQCRRFSTNNNIPCTFQFEEDIAEISNDIKTAIFRICQEAFTHISLHSKATKVSVSTRYEQNYLYLSIKDNGISIQESQPMYTIELVGMRERASSILGDLSFESGNGLGNTLLLKVPILN